MADPSTSEELLPPTGISPPIGSDRSWRRAASDPDPTLEC